MRIHWLCLLSALVLVSCGPRGNNQRPSEETAAAGGGAPAVPAVSVFHGALEGATFEPTRAALDSVPGGLSFKAEGEDPNILITPTTPIPASTITKVVVRIKKLSLPQGEFALFYKVGEGDYDGRHFMYADRWEAMSGDDIKLTYDLAKAPAGSAGLKEGPIAQFRFDPVPSSSGSIIIQSFTTTP